VKISAAELHRHGIEDFDVRFESGASVFNLVLLPST
jgi:hypothetical protein